MAETQINTIAPDTFRGMIRSIRSLERRSETRGRFQRSRPDSEDGPYLAVATEEIEQATITLENITPGIGLGRLYIYDGNNFALDDAEVEILNWTSLPISASSAQSVNPFWVLREGPSGMFVVVPSVEDGGGGDGVNMSCLCDVVGPLVVRDIQARFAAGDITSEQANVELASLQECCSACCEYIYAKVSGVTSGTWDNSEFNATHKLTIVPGSSCVWQSDPIATRTYEGKTWHHKVRVSSSGPTSGLSAGSLILENVNDPDEWFGSANGIFLGNDGCFDSARIDGLDVTLFEAYYGVIGGIFPIVMNATIDINP